MNRILLEIGLVTTFLVFLMISGCIGKGVEGKYACGDGVYMILEKGGKCKLSSGATAVEAKWRTEGDKLILRFENTWMGTFELKGRIEDDKIIFKEKNLFGVETTEVCYKQ